jgi:hypothetical protein
MWDVAQLTAFGQVSIGTVFVLAAIAKLFDKDAFVTFLGMMELPQVLARILARLIPATEIVLGFLLSIGWHLAIVALLATLLTIMFGAALVVAHVRGVQVSCGCFGPIEGTRLSWISTVRAWALALMLLALSTASLVGSQPTSAPLRMVLLNSTCAVLAGIAFSVSLALAAQTLSTRQELRRLQRRPELRPTRESVFIPSR